MWCALVKIIIANLEYICIYIYMCVCQLCVVLLYRYMLSVLRHAIHRWRRTCLFMDVTFMFDINRVLISLHLLNMWITVSCVCLLCVNLMHSRGIQVCILQYTCNIFTLYGILNNEIFRNYIREIKIHLLATNLNALYDVIAMPRVKRIECFFLFTLPN